MGAGDLDVESGMDVLWLGCPLLMALTLGVACFRQDPDTPDDPQRYGRAIVRAAVAVAAWAWLGTEGLSALQSLHRPGVIAWWLVGAAGAIICVVAAAPRRVAATREVAPKAASGMAWTMVYWGAIIALLALAFYQGVVGPPNNVDALGYHLPRLHAWIQQGHVGYFDSWDTRMLAMPPFAEYLGVHVRLLSGTDLLSFLPQWTSLLVACVAVALATRELGGTREHASWAALMLACVPIAILQATNPKNDLVVAAGVAIGVWMLARTARDEKFDISRAVGAGLVLGLLALTKGTGLLYAAVLGLALALVAFRARKVRAAGLLALVVLLIVTINSPHWIRNTATFGSPLSGGEKGDWGVKNEIHSPVALASNLIRNIGLHASLPSPPWNQGVARALASAHRAIGIDQADPRTTFSACRVVRVPEWNPTNEDSAPAPVQLAFALCGALLVARCGWRCVLVYAIGASMLVAMCWVLKWQYWHGRFHLAIFAALMPAIAIASTWRGARVGGVILALTVAGWAVLWSDARPLLGPRAVYRRGDLELQFSALRGQVGITREALREIDRLAPRVVGVHAGAGSLQYALLREIERLPSRPRAITYRWDGTLAHVTRWPTPDVVLLLNTPAKRFVDVPTQTWFDLHVSPDPYRIFVSRPFAEALRTTESLPMGDANAATR